MLYIDLFLRRISFFEAGRWNNLVTLVSVVVPSVYKLHQYWPDRDLLCVFVAAGAAVVPAAVGAGLVGEHFGTVIADDLLDCVVTVDIFFKTTSTKLAWMPKVEWGLRFYGSAEGGGRQLVRGGVGLAKSVCGRAMTVVRAGRYQSPTSWLQ